MEESNILSNSLLMN